MAMESVQTEKKFYAAGMAAARGGTPLVLKQGDTFGIYDRYGDIEQAGVGEQGLYYKGTRHLSASRLEIGGRGPMLLNAAVMKDNRMLLVDLTAPDFVDEDGRSIAKGTIHLFRSKLLWKGVQYEHLRIANYGSEPARFPVTLQFAMDGADIFEVRGVTRVERGTVREPRMDGDDLLLEYRGMDERTRTTRLRFTSGAGSVRVEGTGVTCEAMLEPGARGGFYLAVGCELEGAASPEMLSHEQAKRNCEKAHAVYLRETAETFSTSERFNELANRASADLFMLTTHTTQGKYPYAGVPWFSTPFGRDGIITALQNLWRDTRTARGVLRFLAHYQAREDSPERDAEPGKIVHELREGEMAALGEIPYAAYYGSVDSTPLYLMLAGAYFRRTGDRDFLQSIWPGIEAALRWIDEYGDLDGDGFVEYRRRSENGILQQGWKDSDDSVFHRDGSDAPMPIALCEVQGYVYAAKREIGAVAHALGHSGMSRALFEQARVLKEQFDKAFWCDAIGTYALALDGDKKPCCVRSSNVGHALYTGIAAAGRAESVVEQLLSDDSYSGWGIRTIARSEARYNPMSYHNGSVWPHDNGIIAMGMVNYGFQREALRVVTGVLEAGIALEHKRLPELFCGFDRLEGQAPTLYPVACSPQAWSSGAVFHLVQAALGMQFSASKPQLTFHRPMLPPGIRKLEIANLRVRGGWIDLALRKHRRDVGFNVMRKEGDLEVAVVV